MTSDRSESDFAEMSDWPFPPAYPLHIRSCGGYRDGGPQGGTFYVDLEDAEGRQIPFFFDRFLGRLCYGRDDAGEDAAFLKKGSKVQAEAFAMIEALASESPEYRMLLDRLTRARRWM